MHRILEIVRFLVSLPVRIYRVIISPILPPSCIYRPTCSEYTINAIMKHGVLKGGFLSVVRITRCVGVFFEGGDDPVPEVFSIRQALSKYRLHGKKKRRREADD